MTRTALIAALAASLTLPAVASAQGGPGFLFKQPKVSIGFRTGYALPRAGSDLFDFPRDSLTLRTRDFASPYLGGEVSFRVSERWDVALTVGWARSRAPSEYRNWVELDANDVEQPIEQETTFQRVSWSLSGKYYFEDRGRSVGRFAWVPTRLVPFVGAGVGVVEYTFEQVGDFVDVDTFAIFSDRLKTTGTATVVHATAGADLSLSRQFFVTGEAQYSFARAKVGGNFDGFDKVDLAGLQLLLGIAFRF